MFGDPRLGRVKTSLRGTMAAAATAAVLIAALAGCAGEQSKADACAIVNPAVTDASANLSAALDVIASNPTAAQAQLDAVSTTFANSSDKVTNADIRKVGDTAKASLAALVVDIKKYLGTSGSITDEQLGAAGDKVTADFTAIQAACK